MKWNISESDADRLINGRFPNGEICGHLPVKDNFVSVDYDTEGIVMDRGHDKGIDYLKGFVVTDSWGDRLYYGVVNNNHQSIEYVTYRKGKRR